jgi:SAM-dependent methyltransferase
MKAAVVPSPARQTSYGQHGMSLIDRFGVYLSRRAIDRAVGKGRIEAVLDVGCGYHATLLRALAPRIERGLGVDVRVSDDSRTIEPLEFIEATVDQALHDLPEESFDLVLLISVLEHFWEPLDVLIQLRRVLRPGAALLVNVPTWRGKWFLEFSAFRLGTSAAFEMDDHKTYYDKRDLWPLLVRAGFRPRDIRLAYHKFGLNLFATVRT